MPRSKTDPKIEMVEPLPRTQIPFLSIVIALYNEQAGFSSLKSSLLSVLPKLKCSKVELIFVNDGSYDDTSQQILRWASVDSRVKLIDFARNFGHQVALTAGVDYSQGDAVVIMDGDLQDPPELIHSMLQKYMEGYDVIYAQRLSRRGETRLKRISAAIFYKFMKHFVHENLPENAGDFRLMSRESTNAFIGLREGQRFIRGLITWVGFAQVAVPFERPPRAHGETKFSLRKMNRFAWDAIFSFSQAPLRLGLFFGAAALFSGIGYAFYAGVQKYIYHDTVRGWASLVVLNCIIGGAILICLGFIGEYVGRIYMELKQRPLYIVRRTVNLHAPTSFASSNERVNNKPFSISEPNPLTLEKPH